MKRILIAAAALLPLAGPACAQSTVPVYTTGAGATVSVPAARGGAATVSTDYSANAAAIPMAGLVLLKTIPANTQRAYVEVQNQSAGTVQLVLDDGAGGNQTTILLTGAGAASQGGSWSGWTFGGRVRIYGASGAQVAAYQE